MAGYELSRCRLRTMEAKSGNVERAVKLGQWAIVASAGCFISMKNFMTCFEKGFVNRDTIVE